MFLFVDYYIIRYNSVGNDIKIYDRFKAWCKLEICMILLHLSDDW